jgi:transcriptional regulator with XRE-family HTH domain
MPRRAKAAHVLAKLRSGTGFHQRELAERAGLSQRTVQDIERGVLKLSRRSAMKISEGTGGSVDWLLDNDPSKPIQNSAGKRWSPKDIPARSNPWSQLQSETRRYQLAPRAVLLHQYLRMCDLISGLDNLIEASQEWRALFDDAVRAFIGKYPELQEVQEKETRRANAFIAEWLEENRDKLPQGVPPPSPAEWRTYWEVLKFRDGISANDLQQIKNDIQALEWAYEHPSREKAFWVAIAAGRPISQVSKTLQVPGKKK